MNSIKLYIELIQQALNGQLSQNQAEALLALDQLIETEDKIDNGVFDLEKYMWAFGPTVSQTLANATPNNVSMAEELATFRPLPDTFMNRSATNPLQVIGGLDEKSAVMDAMTLTNPVQKAIEFYDATGYVPTDIQNQAEQALEPLNQVFTTKQIIEQNLANLPMNKPDNLSTEQWLKLKGWSNVGPEDGNELADVIVQWIGSLGIPILGGAVGGVPGALGGAAIAPEMPLEETIGLFDEDTQKVIYASMPAWLLPFIKSTNPNSNVDAAIEAAKEKGGAIDLEKFTSAKNAGAIDEVVENKNTLKKSLNYIGNKLKPTTWAKAFMKSTPAKILTGVILGGAVIRGFTGDVAGPMFDEQPESLPASTTENEVEQTPTTIADLDLPGLDPDLFAVDEESNYEQWITKNWYDTRSLDFYTVPQEQEVDDKTFAGITYGGNWYDPNPTTQAEIYGQRGIQGVLKPGATINPKLFSKVSSGKTWLQLMQEASVKYNVPMEIIYGLAFQETGGSFDNNQEVMDTNGYVSYGFAGINMAPNNFGAGGDEDYIWGNITEEQAKDPEFAINFIGFQLDRYRDYYGGNLEAAIISYRGGIKQGQTYADTGKYATALDKDYLTKIYSWATQSGIGKSYANLVEGSAGKGVARKWTPYSAPSDDIMKGFVDNIVGQSYGRKAVQADYDYWLPQILTMDQEVYNATQTALDKEQSYEGLTTFGKLDKAVGETGEAKFYEGKKNYQTVQDWFTNNFMTGIANA